jgi:prevent-host-death family protein
MVMTMVISPVMKTIKASEFKARCLALMDQVAATGEPIVITKNGEPVSQLVPYRRPPASLFGLHRDQLRILGDVMSPVPAEWEAER